MNTVTITITSCLECPRHGGGPFSSRIFCGHMALMNLPLEERTPKTGRNSILSKMLSVPISYIDIPIPDWCPLIINPNS